MLSVGFYLPFNNIKPQKPICQMASSPPAAAAPTSFSFKNLTQTFTVDVQRAENRPLNVPLIAPFTIATSRLDQVENVAIRIELSNGCVGWGEAPVLPHVTAEDQQTAMVKASEACEVLKESPAMALGSVFGVVAGLLPGHQFASIPIVSPAEAAELASKYRKQGFTTLKLKVGKNLKEDIEVLRAIRAVHPDSSFILDANEGYKPQEAVEVLEKLYAYLFTVFFLLEMGVTPVLFEQPVHRDDWEGLGHVSHIAKDKFGVSVAADESCRSLDDVKKIVKGNLADVINIKLAKVGVLGALEIIEVVRASGLNLMIGGMVETRLAMGFAGHLTAGLGCFKFIDLDTPLLLSEDPVLDGYEVSGAVYKFTNARGHGGFLHWDNIACRESALPINFLTVVLELLVVLFGVEYCSRTVYDTVHVYSTAHKYSTVHEKRWERSKNFAVQKENERVELLLQSLTDSYDQLIINLTNNNPADCLVFDDVAVSVLNEESRRKNKENRQASSQQAEALSVTRGRSTERGPSESHNHSRSKSRRGSVYMRDDHALEIVGIGTIKIKIFDGTICTIGEEVDACVASNGEESMMTWHLKLSHMSEQDIKILSERKLLARLKSVSLPFYEHCVINICMGGVKYMVTFIDDYSRRCWVYSIKKKSDVFPLFQEYKARVELESRKKIKCLSTDNGGEYTDDEFLSFCKQEEAAKTACYIVNRLPSTTIGLKTAMEMWIGKSADYSYLHAFGCPVYVMYNVQERAKLDPKSRRCIFLGYVDRVKGYLRLTTVRVVLAMCATFDLHLEQLDVKTAFLHRELEEEIYMLQPECFAERGNENLVCRFNSDHCAYYKIFENNDFIILLLYVDDMLIASPNKDRIQELKAQLAREFEMKDLGPANKILWMQIHRDKNNRKIWLSQKNYLKKILRHFNMHDCKSMSTPLLVNFKLSSSMCPNNEIERKEMSRVPMHQRWKV
ncbi:Dipeptide epimerase [Citrus sinensis]|nr:Dipeptide epimerase [Citrus sinensis]